MNTSFERNGCKLHIQKEGSGPAILLIHGAGSDASYFTAATEFLKKDYTVLRYDRCGSGKSLFADKDLERDPARHSVLQQVMDARMVLDEFSPKGAIVVGVSAGGVVALELARRYPNFVQELILYEPAIAGSEIARKGVLVWKDQLQDAADRKRVANALLIFINALGGIDPQARAKSLAEQAKSLKNLKVFLQYEMQDFLTYSSRHKEPIRLEMPAVLGIGSLHGESVLSMAAEEAAEWIGAALETVEGYHNFPEERPCDFVKWVKKNISQKVI